tara:strand:+ start:689 stop:1327 length:639 start_codon:yes stop_codon:yes gene_type:complete
MQQVVPQIELTRKFISNSEVKTIDEAEGIVEAYVNTMGVIDADGEIIDVKAFDDSITTGGQSVAWFHDQTSPVGKVIDSATVLSDSKDSEESSESIGRLKAVMQFNLNTQRGREAFADVQFGSVKEWSVGFRSIHDDLERQSDGNHVRVIKNLDWVEVSPVMRGASPDTQTITSKSASGTSEQSDAPDTERKIAELRLRIEIEQTKLEIDEG